MLLRQRPGTAKGITFVTLEDETGTVNLVVHQHTWDRYYRVARRAPAWIAHGHVQTTNKQPVFSPVIHVVVRGSKRWPKGLPRWASSRGIFVESNFKTREGEAPAEPFTHRRLGRSLALPTTIYTLWPANQPVLKAAWKL